MLEYLSDVPVHKNAQSMGNKQQEVEMSVCSTGPRSHCNYRTWWDSSHDCHAVMVAMYFLERTGQ